MAEPAVVLLWMLAAVFVLLALVAQANRDLSTALAWWISAALVGFGIFILAIGRLVRVW